MVGEFCDIEASQGYIVLDELCDIEQSGLHSCRDLCDTEVSQGYIV